MTTVKQKATARPAGRKKEMSEEGGGDYYLLEVRPRPQYECFRFYDVGEPGHIQRLAGRLSNGEWEDQAWIISKKDAHMEDHFLKADSKRAREVLEIYGPAHQVEGDVFIGHPYKHKE